MHIINVTLLAGNKARLSIGSMDTTISLEVPVNKLMSRTGQDLCNAVFGTRAWDLIRSDDGYKALEYEHEAQIAALEDF